MGGPALARTRDMSALAGLSTALGAGNWSNSGALGDASLDADESDPGRGKGGASKAQKAREAREAEAAREIEEQERRRATQRRIDEVRLQDGVEAISGPGKAGQASWARAPLFTSAGFADGVESPAAEAGPQGTTPGTAEIDRPDGPEKPELADQCQSCKGPIFMCACAWVKVAPKDDVKMIVNEVVDQKRAILALLAEINAQLGQGSGRVRC